MAVELTPAERTELNEHIDTLVDLVEDLPLTGVSVLTGGNGRGKSLVRHQLVHPLKKAGLRLASTSLEGRTNSNTSMGELGGINRDLGWLPSSVSTLDQIAGVLALGGVSQDCYVVIDEPELGMGEETQLALGAWMNELIAQRPAHIKGVLVITHSRALVATLAHDHFFNLEGHTTAAAWLARPLVPTDLAALRANRLFTAVQQRGRNVEM